jgi:hypothetical protein
MHFSVIGMCSRRSRSRFEDATDEIRAWLPTITLKDVFDRDVWRKLSLFVRVRPEEDLLPVRTVYNGETRNIGLNYLTSRQSMWIAGPDLIVAIVLGEKVPHVEEALRLVPHGNQKGLKPISLRGMVDIDPRRDDFFRHVVEQRHGQKETNEALAGFLKTLGNSGSYGIFVEPISVFHLRRTAVGATVVEKAIARGPTLARWSPSHRRRASFVTTPDSVSVAMRGKHPGASARPGAPPESAPELSSFITENMAAGGVSTGTIAPTQTPQTIARARNVRRRPYCNQSTGEQDRQVDCRRETQPLCAQVVKVLGHRQPIRQRLVLGDVAEPQELPARQAARVHAQDQCRAAVRSQDVDEHSQRRRLAGAVLTNQRVDRTLRYAQADVADRVMASKPLREAFGFDDHDRLA